ncbi:hypothetical protein WOLCODRAFT_159725 [Wolfiporia cocos MD-104 SS10]|uniref:Fungal-type protein kinase domain-containing protein n=1 Tax=Wolfiporia cocos (strain MD-104) TaxID=742152 RepID=A0A2H3JPC9_WOLCO|nr:hypothetical protein WOLCODRAFT_159725 [Wolfiporia cocos MD-104 SS10]
MTNFRNRASDLVEIQEIDGLGIGSAILAGKIERALEQNTKHGRSVDLKRPMWRTSSVSLMGFDPVLGTTTTTPYRIKAIQYPWRLEQRNKDNPERLKAWLSELYDKVGVVDVPLDGDDADSSSMAVEDSGATDVSAKRTVVHYVKINAYLEKHNIPRYGLAKMLYGEDLGETSSFHVTISATAKYFKNGPRNERSHMRIVLDIVGEPLSKFTSTKQLIRAIRDAIIGHLLAYLSGAVEFCGFIDDLDYGSPVDSSKFRWKGIKGTPFQGKSLRGTLLSAGEQKRFRELENELKERTGTVEFMAMELMNADPKQDVSHQVHHDLESFFWLLVWFVLRHTNHDHKEGKGTFAKVFGANVPEDARERKENMLLRNPWSPMLIF